MKRDNIRQFKLSSGEELICEVVEWHASDEDLEEIVVRNMYNIISADGDEPGSRYYAFRPFLCLQNSESIFQTLNPFHIVATAIPTINIIEQFESTVELNNMTYDELKEEINKTVKRIKKKLNLNDNDEEETNKIIKFVPKDKLH